jgi:hypothetical protein
MSNRPTTTACIEQWRTELHQETHAQLRARLAKYGADVLLFEKEWAGADSFETRWKDLEAILDAVVKLQAEVMILIDEC